MARSLFIVIAAWILTAAPPAGSASDPVARHACGPPGEPAPAPAPLQEGVALTVEVRDAATSAALPARVGVWDGSSAVVAPPATHADSFQSLLGSSYFYSAGEATLLVPAGLVTIRAGHGFEYVPAETTLAVTEDRTVVIALERFADMNAAGWYAGDTHVHISHPPVNRTVTPEMLLAVMDAEGLNVVNSMEEEAYFTGALHPASTADRLLHFGKEERNAHFGHYSLMGLHEWIPDQTCEQLYTLCGRTPSWWISDMVRSRGPHTLIIATHPFPTWEFNDISPWPGGGVWRSMSLDILGGHVDAMDLMNYTTAPPPAGAEDYFHALDLGFRIAPSAGTDATLSTGASYPAGGYRVYAYLGGEALTFEGWVEAVRAGRSFVTNYPLVEDFSVGGARPGDELSYTGTTVPVHVEVTCARPFASVEIIAGSAVVQRIDTAPGTTALDATFEVEPGGAGWILARVRGVSGGWHVIDANGLFAQTAPVYLSSLDGATPEPDSEGFDPLQLAANRFRNFTEDAADLFDIVAMSPQARAEFDSATAYAVDFYENAWPDPPDPFNLVSPLDYSWNHGRTWVRTVTPTFRWRRATDPDPGDTVRYEFMLDTDYLFDDPVTAADLEDTTFTVPEAWDLEDQGIYYWRVTAIDRLGNRRLATPGLWTFVIDMTSTGAADGPPRDWALRRVYPNPFNPMVRVTYTVPPDAGAHRLEVFDASGHRVRTLFSGDRPPGVYDERWDGRDTKGTVAASGVYFIRLVPAGEAPVTRKAVLLK